MNEVERVREQALLTYEEIEEVRARLEDEYEDEEMTDVEWEEFVWGKIAHAQLDKVLKTEGIAVLDDAQGLPENYYEYSRHGCYAAYDEAQQHMKLANFKKVVQK